MLSCELKLALLCLPFSSTIFFNLTLKNMLIDRPGHIRLGDFGLSTLAEDGPVYGCRGSLRCLLGLSIAHS